MRYYYKKKYKMEIICFNWFVFYYIAKLGLKQSFMFTLQTKIKLNRNVIGWNAILQI